MDSLSDCGRSTSNSKISRPIASNILAAGLCSAFDQLNEAGAAALFWGDDHRRTKIEERLRAARAKVSAFDERIGAIEARRRAQLDAINEQQEHAEWLEDDVFEALEEEERIKHEWIVEREIDAIRAAAMASWTQSGEDDRRFRKTAPTRCSRVWRSR